MDERHLKFALGTVTAGITGIFDIHPVVTALFILTFLDIASGWMKAYVTSTVSSDASRKGMVKKAFQLLLVATAWVAEHQLGVVMPVDLDLTLAGFFCATEVISIIENAGQAGVPLPDAITQRFKTLLKEKTNGGN